MARDLIVFGEDWGAHPSSTQHLVRLLAADRGVLWVNSIGLRRPRLSVRDLGRAWRKLRAALARPAADGAPARPGAAIQCETLGPLAPFPVVQPLALPMAQGMWARALNRVLLGRRVRGAAGALRRPVVWASLPSAVQALGACGESAVVYYCGDDFGALAGVDHAAALAMEAEMAARADLILAASPALAARFPAHKTALLEHGVDYRLFATPAPRPADLPKGPVAGFYGSLAPWLDLRLVAATARLLPDWRFLFIGNPSAGTDLAALEGVGNIVRLGPKPHAALPGYAQHWTAGLIPFLDNDQIRACNPLKLREYLAAGRPVVSTPFPALQPYAGLVHQATTAAGFAAALQAAAAAAPGPDAARQRAVAAESWSARAARAAQLIEAL